MDDVTPGLSPVPCPLCQLAAAVGVLFVAPYPEMVKLTTQGAQLSPHFLWLDLLCGALILRLKNCRRERRYQPSSEDLLRKAVRKHHDEKDIKFESEKE